MNKRIASLFGIIQLTALIIFFPACKKTTGEIPDAKNRIAYVYSNDNTAAAAFKALLDSNNCQVTLVAQSNSATTDYSNYKLIVLDDNTETVGGSNWTTVNTTAINSSGKPLLLLGTGGLFFATKIGNTANWGNSGGFSASGILVKDEQSTLYKMPHTIAIPADHQLSLYPNTLSVSGQHVLSGTLANNVLIGNLAAQTNYYPVTSEQEHYTVFGFHSGVNMMNQTGRKFMVNLAYYAGKLTW